MSAAPSQSTGACAVPVARGGTARETSINVSTTNGMFTAKIRRQDTASTRNPPASGPTTVAIPAHAVHEPMAAPRSSGANAVTITARALGVRSAPNPPCRARQATNTSMLGAIAQRSETMPNPATPMENTRRSPNTSPSEPPTRISDPSARRYAFETHCWPASPPPRSARIAGRATFTAVASRPATNEPMIAATSASCLLGISSIMTKLSSQPSAPPDALDACLLHIVLTSPPSMM